MSWWAWTALSVGLGALFFLDFFRFGRGGQPVSPAKAARWSVAWLAVGAAFALVVWAAAGASRLRFLKHGLGVILGIAGARLILDEFHPVATWVELLSVLVVLVIAVAASLTPVRRRDGEAPASTVDRSATTGR